ncbi:hypothetical protein J3R83DRAFT_7973 [Lanmaoa asiatica]|nr:hypothetical protein J3R83DRAFT_7973 [Lanmaoa asiatica]
MATDFLSSTSSTATVAGLFVAGLGAVYAYTQLLGTPEHTRTQTYGHTADGDAHAKNEGEVKSAGGSTSGTTQKGRRKKKGKGVDTGEDEGGSKGKGEDEDKVPFPRAVPGDFEGAGASAGAGAGAKADVGANNADSGKPKTNKKKKKKKQGKGKDGDEDKDKEGGSETGKDTDASVSHSPSVSVSALASPRAVGKGNLRASPRLAPPSQPHVQTRVHAPSQPREIRLSLSFDTDSSWTHVDHRRLGTSTSTNGQTTRPMDSIDVTSSDIASTASESPVAEQINSVSTDMRGTRADLVQRTLAEKFVPRPRKTGVSDMLEQPDFPTVARVMRVQPRADETPVPGFSWEDYGDVVEDSLLVHDADQEDEGEWGVVKSRNRTRPLQTTTTTTSSTSYAPAAPETMTKKQRQNARKRELAKSAKAEAEATRLEGLAKHKGELERLRIIEQSRQGGGKRPSGGMQATVDDRGKLVWE